MATITLSLALLRDSNGQPIGTIGVSKDITEHVKAEEALLDSERRYRLLFLNNPHPMWVYDIETLAFLAVNDAAIHHYGYSREEFLGMTIKDIRPPEDVPALQENVAKVTTGIDKAGVWRHRKKDGTIIYVEITSHTLNFEGRRAEVVLANDITERKLAEEELQKAHEELQKKVEELERFTKHTVGRELRMMELKNEIRELRQRLAEYEGRK